MIEKQITVTLPIDRYEKLLEIEEMFNLKSCAIHTKNGLVKYISIDEMIKEVYSEIYELNLELNRKKSDFEECNRLLKQSREKNLELKDEIKEKEAELCDIGESLQFSKDKLKKLKYKIYHTNIFQLPKLKKELENY